VARGAFWLRRRAAHTCQRVIDLHCHILPGVDDGPKTMQESVAMARVAYEDGVRTIVATPHVSHDYPTNPEEIAERVDELNAALSAADVDLTVVAGAELAFNRLAELDEAAINACQIGSGPYILVESPYTYTGDMVERLIEDLQIAGLRPVLAHPERSGAFLGQLERLDALVDRDVLCSLTAGSLTAGFGSTVRAAARAMLSTGLVHNLASDAHNVQKRNPALTGAEPELSHAGWQWLTVDVPQAIVVGGEPPAAPGPLLQKGRLRTALGRFSKR
jgi:protein-tyrosine phosphatase